jgi:hypothetical protein
MSITARCDNSAPSEQPIDLQKCKALKRVLGHNAKDVVHGIIADALGYLSPVERKKADR